MSAGLIQTIAYDGRALDARLRDERASLEEALRQGRAVLFRGFPNVTSEGFRGAVGASSKRGPLEYVFQSTPRTAVGDNLYTATEYPASQSIPLHNENAYFRDWPMRLYFWCQRPATTGGETPIADTAKVTARIDPDVRRRFEREGVLYVRNYRKGLDVPWQRVFQTESRQEVETFCKAHEIEVEWRKNGSLCTRQRSQGLARHPVTDAEVWMNQAHLFHVSNLDRATRDSLTELFPEDELPRHAYFGDGSPIDDDVLEHVRESFLAEQVLVPWQAHDVLVIDNMLTSHGRQPFTGERKLLVAMADLRSETDARSTATA
jgi:alpha-ketoglutarate-dependent taurine dioxygenase